MSAPDFFRAGLGFPALAFLLGFFRAWTRPVLSDGAMQLVRSGGAWLTGSFEALGVPPGAHDAPLLGSMVAAAGAAIAGTPETLARPAAAVLLGAAAAILVSTLRRHGGFGGVAVGLVVLVLPPAFPTAFALRPDAALGGTLMLFALATTAGRGRTAGASVALWLAALATTAAIPAAIAHDALPDGDGRRADLRRTAILGAVVVAIVAVAMLAIPAAGRALLLGGIFAGWSLPPGDFASTGTALRDGWAWGLLLLAPLVGPWIVPGARLPAAVRGAWVSAAGASLLFSTDGAFREHAAALIPTAAWLLGRLVAAIPDANRRPGTPARPVIAAMFIPIALFVVSENADRLYRTSITARAARYAQIAAVIDAPELPRGDVLARGVGAMRAHGTRAVRPIRGTQSGLEATGGAPPAIVVLGEGGAPRGRGELRLYSTPGFLAGWAPRAIGRGPNETMADVVWVRREVPSAAVDPDVAGLLLRGRRERAAGRVTDALRTFETAATRERAPLGLAAEEAGLAASAAGETAIARTHFRTARRDPSAARARVRLADAAIDDREYASADSLLVEASRWSAETPGLHAVQARLFWETSNHEPALFASDAATRRAPGDPRTLVNHGAILWGSGQPDAARKVWDRAVKIDPGALRVLGDYRNAPEDSPAPPLLPLWGPLRAPRSPSAPPPEPSEPR